MPRVEAIFNTNNAPVPRSGTKEDSPALQRWVGVDKKLESLGDGRNAGLSTPVLARDDKREEQRFFRNDRDPSTPARKSGAPALRMTEEKVSRSTMKEKRTK